MDNSLSCVLDKVVYLQFKSGVSSTFNRTGGINLESLCRNGVNHIELRMFDLNPLVSIGVEEKDIIFAQLLMVWFAATPGRPFSEKDQIQAVQNFKNAACYDLKTVNILMPDGEISIICKRNYLLP